MIYSDLSLRTVIPSLGLGLRLTKSEISGEGVLMDVIAFLKQVELSITFDIFTIIIMFKLKTPRIINLFSFVKIEPETSKSV
jgi:hypothetical protein